MTDDAFTETDERAGAAPRRSPSWPAAYGREYFTAQARSGGKTTDLWLEIGKHGYLGVNIPEEYGGGGGGIGDVAAVLRGARRAGLPAADDGRSARRSAAR